MFGIRLNRGPEGRENLQLLENVLKTIPGIQRKDLPDTIQLCKKTLANVQKLLEVEPMHAYTAYELLVGILNELKNRFSAEDIPQNILTGIADYKLHFWHAMLTEKRLKKMIDGGG